MYAITFCTAVNLTESRARSFARVTPTRMMAIILAVTDFMIKPQKKIITAVSNQRSVTTKPLQLKPMNKTKKMSVSEAKVLRVKISSFQAKENARS